MHRLFVAIRPPASIRDILIDAMDDGPGLRWVSDDNLHLTLRFIGEVERPLADDIVAALAQVRAEPFALRLSGVGQFRQRKGGSAWAGVAPKEPVAALAGKVDRACQRAGIEPEHRAFVPHITLARWNRPPGGATDALTTRNVGLSSAPFPVDRFQLFESHLSRHEPHYEMVADYPLGTAERPLAAARD